MANNFPILDKDGVSRTIATRDVSGVHYQNVAATTLKHYAITAASTNATNIAAAAAILRGVYLFNIAAYPVYLKFHNTAGTPTAGSGVIIGFPAQAGTGLYYPIPGGGLDFTSGLAYTVVKGITNADAVAVAANDALIGVFYDFA